MPNLILPRRYTTQKPVLGSQLDYSHPLSRGLVGCWLMNEGAGNVVKDITGRNNGTNSGAIWTPTQKGVGLNFDGSSSYINIPDSSSLGLISNWTYSAWIKRDNTTKVTNDPIFSQWNGQSSGRQIAIYVAATIQNDRIEVDVPWIAVILQSNTRINNTQWHHIVVTKSANVWTCYIDGKLDKQVTTATSQENSTDSLTIGLNRPDNHYFDGNIELPLIYSRALSPSEIMSLYIAPYQMIAPRRRFIIDVAGGTPEPPPSTVTPYGYMTVNKGWW